MRGCTYLATDKSKFVSLQSLRQSWGRNLFNSCSCIFSSATGDALLPCYCKESISPPALLSLLLPPASVLPIYQSPNALNNDIGEENKKKSLLNKLLEATHVYFYLSRVTVLLHSLLHSKVTLGATLQLSPDTNINHRRIWVRRDRWISSD